MRRGKSVPTLKIGFWKNFKAVVKDKLNFKIKFVDIISVFGTLWTGFICLKLKAEIIS